MGPPPAATQNLPIVDTVLAVYRTVFGNIRALLTAAMVPFLLSLALTAAEHAAAGSTTLFILLLVLAYGPLTLFGVTWHRFVLFGSAAAPIFWLSAWRPRHWRFFGYALALGLVALGIEFLIGLAAFEAMNGAAGSRYSLPYTLASLGSLLLIVYLTLRLSFVFPAVAVDESYGPGDSWRHTRGQTGRMFVAFLLIVLVLGFFVSIALTVMSNIFPATEEGRAIEISAGFITIVKYLLVLVEYLGIALSVTFASTAFQTCTGWIPDSSGPPARQAPSGSCGPEQGT